MHGVDRFVSACVLLLCLLYVAVCSTSVVCAVRSVSKTRAREAIRTSAIFRQRVHPGGCGPEGLGLGLPFPLVSTRGEAPKRRGCCWRGPLLYVVLVSREEIAQAPGYRRDPAKIEATMTVTACY